MKYYESKMTLNFGIARLQAMLQKGEVTKRAPFIFNKFNKSSYRCIFLKKVDNIYSIPYDTEDFG